MAKDKRPKIIKTNRSGLDEYLNSLNTGVDTDVLEPDEQPAGRELDTKSPFLDKYIKPAPEKPLERKSEGLKFEEKPDTFDSLLKPETVESSSTGVKSPKPRQLVRELPDTVNTEEESLITQLVATGDTINQEIEKIDLTDQQQVDEINKVIEIYQNTLNRLKKVNPIWTLPPEVIQNAYKNVPLVTNIQPPSISAWEPNPTLNVWTGEVFNYDAGKNAGDRERAGNYAALVKAMNRNIPVDDAIKSNDLRGTPIGRLGGSFTQGVLSIPEGFVSFGEMIAEESGLGFLKPIFEQKGKQLEDIINGVAPPDPDLVEQLMSGVGSMISFMVPGVAAGNLGNLAKLSTNVAKWLGVGTSAMLEAITEAGLVYKESEDSEAAAKTFAANLLMVGITNRYGLFADEQKPLIRALTSTGLEGLQEGLQEIISQGSQGKPIDWDAVITSLGIGAVIGGGAGYVQTSAAEREQQTAQKEESFEGLFPKPQTQAPKGPVDASTRAFDKVAEVLNDEKIQKLQDEGVEFNEDIGRGKIYVRDKSVKDDKGAVPVYSIPIEDISADRIDQTIKIGRQQFEKQKEPEVQPEVKETATPTEKVETEKGEAAEIPAESEGIDKIEGYDEGAEQLKQAEELKTKLDNLQNKSDLVKKQEKILDTNLRLLRQGKGVLNNEKFDNNIKRLNDEIKAATTEKPADQETEFKKYYDQLNEKQQKVIRADYEAERKAVFEKYDIETDNPFAKALMGSDFGISKEELAKRQKEFDAIDKKYIRIAKNSVTKPAVERPVVKTEQDIFNPIDTKASDEEKLKQIKELSAVNKPILEEFTKKIDEKFGSISKVSTKEDDKMFEKTYRPEILEKKPYHKMEHITDSLRGYSIIDNVDQVIEIKKELDAAGFEVLTEDISRMIRPKIWGWRSINLDLRMPNGQIVEYQLPVREMKEVKKQGHSIFEKWRNKDEEYLQDHKAEYERDILDSNILFGDAWDKHLKRIGQTPRAFEASLNKVLASFESVPVKKSFNSFALGNSLVHFPSLNVAELVVPSGFSQTTKASPDSDVAANILEGSDIDNSQIVAPKGSEKTTEKQVDSEEEKPDISDEKGVQDDSVKQTGPEKPIEGEIPGEVSGTEGGGGPEQLGGTGTEAAAEQGEGTKGTVSTPEQRSDQRTGARKVSLNKNNYRIKANQKEDTTFRVTQRYEDNVAAIKLLKELQSKKKKTATKAQKEILAKYVGWGGLSKVFDDYYYRESPEDRKWQARNKEVKELLTEDEYRAASASTPNAHYTSQETIEYMWKLMQKLGFEGGNILEPGMGNGKFFGLLPKGISDQSNLTGIELDDITTQIAQYLYPDATINEGANEGKGYQEIYIPANSQDLVITNVPFANVQIFDETEPDAYWSKNKQSLHNFFILKSMDKVKPGGLMAIITSHFTMDSKNTGVRGKLIEQADLIAAYKLPNTAFQGNANTYVTTDILVFRKKDPKIPYTGKTYNWLTAKPFDYEGLEATLNQYYFDNPKDVFGKLTVNTRMRGDNEISVEPEGDLKDHFRKALNRIPDKVFTATPETKPTRRASTHIGVKKRNPGNYYVEGKKVYRLDENGEPVEVKDVKNKEVKRFLDMTILRDKMLDTYSEQLKNPDDKAVKSLISSLDKSYDRFVSQYGNINSDQNKKFFKEDPDYSRMRALEIYDEDTKKWNKSDLLKNRVFSPVKTVDKIENPKEAMGYVLAQQGELDLERIAELTGSDVEKVRADLIGRGAIFEDINGELITEDEYLSGRVVEKLKAAEKAAEKDPKFKKNVDALKAVQPKRIPFVDIETKLGANFVPAEVYEKFINELFDVRLNMELKYLSAGERGKWIIKSEDKYKLRGNAKNTSKYGTNRLSGFEIIDKIMNNSPLVIYDTDMSGKRVFNPDATLAVQGKAQDIKDAWKAFSANDKQVRDIIEEEFNNKLNTTTRRIFNGDHLTLPGKADIVDGREYHHRPYQKNAIWRGIQNLFNLFDHPVGSGKTGTLTSMVMERIRLGLSNKAIYVTKKGLVQQVYRESQALYPQAKIYMPEPNDFKAENRPAFLNRTKTHDWDMVIMSYENFKNLSLSPEIEVNFMEMQLSELEMALRVEVESATESYGRRKKSHSQKELEKKIQRLAEKLRERKAKIDKQRKKTKNQIEYFDQLGFDYLVVDEAHNFKNLYAPTSRNRVKGIGTSESQRAFDMSMKLWWLAQKEGMGATFATGTPVSNALTEFFIMQRYLQRQSLKDVDAYSLDAWLDMFAEEQSRLEIAPTGKGMQMTNRVSKLVNLPELMKIYSEIADIVTKEEVQKHMDLPKIKGGKVENIEVPASEAQLALYNSLADRMELIKSGKVEATEDNPLVVTSDGRMASMDMRLLDPKAEDYADNKVNTAVEYIADIWKETKKEKLTQVVFMDQGVPGGARIDLYNDMKNKLVKKGVPVKQIAFSHDAKNDKQLELLYKKVNNGDIRILIGSTGKLSEGVNIQKRLYALHHMNPTYKPAELEQREGRIIRYGNTNKEIRILRYITKGQGDVAGFDAYMYQLLENKIRGISQASNPDTTIRSVEEADGRALTYAEVKALATGNPMVMEKIQLEHDVRILEKQYNEFRYQQADIAREMSALPTDIERIKKQIKSLEDFIKTIPDDKTVTINGKKYDTSNEKQKKAAGDAIYEESKKLWESKKAQGTDIQIGTYGPFNLWLVVGFGNVEMRIIPAKDVQMGWYLEQEKLKHTVSNVGGVNINRILAAKQNFQTNVDDLKTEIESKETRLKGLKAEISDKFSKADEYREKSARLAEVDKALDVNSADQEAETETKEGEEDEEAGHINQKLYEALKETEVFDIDELAEMTGKKKKDISTALNDLRKRKLVNAVPGGYAPTDEFKILLDDMNQNPEKYEDDFNMLYSNPLPAMLKGISRAITSIDDVYKKYVGDKVYKAVGSIVNKITPEQIKHLIVTNYGLPTEYIAARREAYDALTRYKELAQEIATNLTYRNPATGEKFTDAEQKRLAQVIKGSVTMNPLIRERASKAISEIKEMEKLGKELEVLPVETYNTKLPRKRIQELLKEKRKLVEKRLELLRPFPESEWESEAAQKVTRGIDRKIDAIHTRIRNSYVHGGEGYLKRVYMSKESARKLAKYGYYKPTRLDLTSAMHRKDIPYEIRKEMGEILTAAYPAAKGIMLEGKDISFGRFFEVISENPDWSSESEVSGWVKMEKDPKLGKLSEMYVEPKIAADINDVMKFTSKDELDKFLKRINATWKATKTIMNPSTHMRNIYSNTIMLDFSGVAHTDQIRILPEAIKAIKGTGKYATQFKASRLNNSTFTTQELGQYLELATEDRGFIDLSLPDKLLKIYGKASLVDTKVGQFLGRVYQMEEVLGKAVKFISEIEKGKTIKEARDEANKWLFDYGEIPSFIRKLRTNPIFGVPFVTWSYKAFPRIIEAAITRPLAFWKYPVIFSALLKYALKALDIDDKEWEAIKADLPERMIKGEWLLLPFRDSKGKMQMLDLTYILPYKDVYDVVQSGFSLVTGGKLNNEDDVVDGMLGVIQAPILKTVSELLTNKNTYTNQQIWFDIDSPAEKLQKAFDHTYKAFMPSLAPEIPFLSQGGYSWHKMSSVIQHKDDYYGRSFSFAPALASVTVGLKTSPVEPEKNIERKEAKLQRRLIQLSTKENQILRDGSLSEEQRLAKAMDLEQEKDQIRKEMAAMEIPVKNEEIATVEKQIRSLQAKYSRVDLDKTKVREQYATQINKLKIKLNELLSSPNAFTGERRKKEDKKKKQFNKTNTRSFQKEL